MEVVFSKGVNKFTIPKITLKHTGAVWWVLAALCVSSSLAARTDVIRIGGDQNRARIVFNLQKFVLPRLSQDGRTLIVKFPDTVGDPISLSDVSVIDNVAFDGKTAVISVKQPFTYTKSSSEKQSQYIIDIAVQKRTGAPCPIGNVISRSNVKGITLDIFVQDGMWPEIRYARNRRVFLIFKGDVNCPNIGRQLSKVPCLEFSGTYRLAGGTAVGISLTDPKADLEIRTEEKAGRITFDIVTVNRMSRTEAYAMAKSSYDQGDVASTIHTLERYKESLDPKESLLLGRAYWKVAYPYYMDVYSLGALKNMTEGIRGMSPGIGREWVMLEYARMLMYAKEYPEAMKCIRFLEESISSEIAIEAYLLEIDIMNRKKQFQEAFVQNRRMLTVFDKEGIPPRLNAYYNATLADTYLGLNSYERALQLYKAAISENTGIFRSDPGLYGRMAEAAYSAKDYVTAQQYFLWAINLGRREEKANYLISLGDCLYQLGRKDKAMGVFSEVESMSPQSESTVIAKLKTARIIMENDIQAHGGKLSDKTFRQVMNLYNDLKSTPEFKDGPMGSIIRVRIAQAYAKRGQWDDALDAYREAWADTKKDDPIHQYAQEEAEKCIAAHVDNLRTLGKLDRISDLYTAYQDSFMRELKTPDALIPMGKAMMELGNLDQARSMLVASLRSPSPRTEEALSALLSIDYQRGDHTRALEWNTRYLREFPQGRDAWKMQAIRGELLYYSNRFAEALPCLEKAVNQGGKRTPFDLSLLADTYARLGNHAQQAATLDKLLAYGAGQANVSIIEKALYMRATQLKEASDLTRAKELYKKLLNSYPASSYRDWALYHLAEVYHAEGNDQEAARLVNIIIEKSSDKTMRALAANYLGEMSLGNEVSEYTRLINQFGRK